MNRLTGWDKGNAYCLKCFENGGCPDMGTSKCDFCEHHIAVYDRCAAYEDTGLMPEDVVRLNDFEHSQMAKLLEENGRLRAELDMAWKQLHVEIENEQRLLAKAEKLRADA